MYVSEGEREVSVWMCVGERKVVFECVREK